MAKNREPVAHMGAPSWPGPPRLKTPWQASDTDHSGLRCQVFCRFIKRLSALWQSLTVRLQTPTAHQLVLPKVGLGLGASALPHPK